MVKWITAAVLLVIGVLAILKNPIPKDPLDTLDPVGQGEENIASPELEASPAAPRFVAGSEDSPSDDRYHLVTTGTIQIENEADLFSGSFLLRSSTLDRSSTIRIEAVDGKWDVFLSEDQYVFESATFGNRTFWPKTLILFNGGDKGVKLFAGNSSDLVLEVFDLQTGAEIEDVTVMGMSRDDWLKKGFAEKKHTLRYFPPERPPADSKSIARGNSPLRVPGMEDPGPLWVGASGYAAKRIFTNPAESIRRIGIARLGRTTIHVPTLTIPKDAVDGLQLKVIPNEGADPFTPYEVYLGDPLGDGPVARMIRRADGEPGAELFHDGRSWVVNLNLGAGMWKVVLDYAPISPYRVSQELGVVEIEVTAGSHSVHTLDPLVNWKALCMTNVRFEVLTEERFGDVVRNKNEYSLHLWKLTSSQEVSWSHVGSPSVVRPHNPIGLPPFPDATSGDFNHYFSDLGWMASGAYVVLVDGIGYLSRVSLGGEAHCGNSSTLIVKVPATVEVSAWSVALEEDAIPCEKIRWRYLSGAANNSDAYSVLQHQHKNRWREVPREPDNDEFRFRILPEKIEIEAAGNAISPQRLVVDGALGHQTVAIDFTSQNVGSGLVQVAFVDSEGKPIFVEPFESVVSNLSVWRPKDSPPSGGLSAVASGSMNPFAATERVVLSFSRCGRYTIPIPSIPGWAPQGASEQSVEATSVIEGIVHIVYQREP